MATTPLTTSATGANASQQAPSHADDNQVTVSLSEGNVNATGQELPAQAQSQTVTTQPSEGYGMSGSLLQSSLTMGAYLFLILAVILLAFFLLRKFGPSSMARGKGGAQPELKGRLMLGHKQSVAVVRVLGRVLVLGVTDRSITLLDRMSAKDCLAPDQAEDENAFTKFAEMLGKNRDEKNGG